jgi:hypothetical protein
MGRSSFGRVAVINLEEDWRPARSLLFDTIGAALGRGADRF